MLSRNSLSKPQEVEYQSYLKDEKIKLTRFMCILSSILYASFIVVDVWALPSAFKDAMLIRVLVIACLALTYISTYSHTFEKFYSHIVAGIYFIATLGIEAMIYIASPSDQAYETYFVGVILILITLFSWTYLKLRVSVPLAIVSILGYVYIEVIDRNMVVNSREAALVTNIFLLGSASLIGFIAQILRDSYLRQNYLLQQSLHEAYKAKAAEAKDNEYLANHDALTGLPNRRYMTQLLEDSIKEAEEKDKVLIIMFLDLNGFKQVNDIYGHAAGDKVLKVVAKRLELAIRSGDHISRLGGDEYLIGLMMDKNHLCEVENMTEKFTSIIAQPMNIEGVRVKVGSSIGLSAYPIHGNQISVLLDIADKRMYDAKKGRTSTSLQTVIEQEDNNVTAFPGKKA